MRRLVLVTGTGTEIGKTHTSEAMLLAWRESAVVCGLKPIETGVAPGEEGDDARRLRLASTFHVKHPAVTFERAVSPHLAARDAGTVIAPEVVVDLVARARRDADLLVELPGGLFSPLAPGYSNADLALALRPTAVLLVAPDRLGVLHDIAAATRAAASVGLHLSGIVLSTPATPDSSTGANAAEVPVVTAVPLLATLPRRPSAELAKSADLRAALASLTR